MQYPIAFLGFGILLLVIGLVGGDLSYKGFTIPKVGPLPRFTTTIVGAVCIAISVLAWAVELADPQTDPSPTPVAQSLPVSSPPTSPAAQSPVTFSVGDHLTEGIEEETIVVSLEGNRVATLHATRDEPVVGRTVQVAQPGSYGYVVDAEMTWLDDDGSVQTTNATGRGSIYVDDGLEIEPYIHLGSDDSVTLSLENVSSQS